MNFRNFFRRRTPTQSSSPSSRKAEVQEVRIGVVAIVNDNFLFYRLTDEEEAERLSYDVLVQTLNAARQNGQVVQIWSETPKEIRDHKDTGLRISPSADRDIKDVIDTILLSYEVWIMEEYRRRAG